MAVPEGHAELEMLNADSDLQVDKEFNVPRVVSIRETLNEFWSGRKKGVPKEIDANKVSWCF